MRHVLCMKFGRTLHNAWDFITKRWVMPSTEKILGRASNRTFSQEMNLYMGCLLIFFGAIGFFASPIFGANLSIPHHLVHLISGILFVWVGLLKSKKVSYYFAFFFGGLYLIVGVAGFIWGHPGESMMGTGDEDPFLMHFLSKNLVFGTDDNIFHLLIGASSLVSVVFARSLKKDAEKLNPI